MLGVVQMCEENAAFGTMPRPGKLPKHTRLGSFHGLIDARVYGLGVVGSQDEES